MSGPARSCRFPRAYRLVHARQFLAVRRGGMPLRAGPLTAHARPNDLPYWRLGLTVSRRVGPAVIRNRLKRLLREAFRLSHPDLPRYFRAGSETPGGYDLLLTPSPHALLTLTQYRRLVMELAERLHQMWRRRSGGTA